MAQELTRPPQMPMDARQKYLSEAHVGILSVAREEQGPLSLPIWYSYEPGEEIRLITRGDSPKAEIIRRAGRVTLCVQSPEPPYRYVTAEGPIRIQDTVTSAEREALAARYLGPEFGAMFVQATAEATPIMIAVYMRPESWLSQDQTNWP
ncbi:pyridoxamine 5'-phosphate oxidase family protein [Spirillospora sp. CA-294931]|uniref:pyridoxamine 5'-phosphate oxidase family protein n=1 Tax=Spirillospora sp. CA-294931 TaxID=3240042 RepID=UPI003D8FC5D3